MRDEDLHRELLGYEVALARRDGSVVGDLEALVAPDFVEFGSSGRRWDRETTVGLLADAGAATVVLEDFHVDRLADDVALATYVSTATDEAGSAAHVRRTRRASLWIRRDGRWLIRIHQGTPIDPG